jgi:hypothetical protein
MPLKNAYPPKYADKFKEGVEKGLKKSKNAQAIWNYLEVSGRDYDVIILPDDGSDLSKNGQMLTEPDQSVEGQRGRKEYDKYEKGPIPRPLVLWNPNYEFKYYGDVEGVVTASNGDRKAKSANILDPYILLDKNFSQLRMIRLTLAKMPPEIILYHELGHVKQYYEAGGTDILWKEKRRRDACKSFEKFRKKI